MPPLDACLDVSQECTPNEMIFTLRTYGAFNGRIYTFKNFDRSPCYIRGNGGQVHRLVIPRSESYPNCGTEGYGDTQTNIVVVQHSELVQTSKDSIYNLTCTMIPPGESVVSSSYIGAGSGEPTQIEYLPAEHTLDSQVQLMIEYKGRPTTTIAVGDELTFKLRTLDGVNLVSDIFASNVVAKDPYTQRTIELIDRNGCPVDPAVFPSLGLSRSGDGIETTFNAFKIPESNFLVFEATVNTCRGGCQAAYCQGPEGRSLQSYGRKKRNAEDDINLREMFRVYETREDIPESKEKLTEVDKPKGICMSHTEYYGISVTIILLVIIVIVVTIVAGLCYRKVREFSDKIYDNSNMFPSAIALSSSADGDRRETRKNGGKRSFYLPERMETMDTRINSRFDPSEPICTDTTMFERNRFK